MKSTVWVKMIPLTLVFTYLTSFYAVVASNTNSLNNILFSGDYEFIDLTHPFDNQSVYWPDVQKFVFSKKIEHPPYSAYEFTAGEHGGTHIDAPYHFNRFGLHAGEIPLEKLIVPLIVADVSSQVNDDPNFVLYKRHLDYLINDNFGKPCLIVFKFGWSKYFNDTQKYLGLDDYRKTLNFPSLSNEVAEWITSSYKNVVGIGVDVASVDPGSSTDFPVHKTASKAGLYNVENVNLSQPIPDHGCTALVLPMKIAEGTGAPLRLVAICPKQVPNAF